MPVYAALQHAFGDELTGAGAMTVSGSAELAEKSKSGYTATQLRLFNDSRNQNLKN